jgi:hypothetical protein
VGKSFLSAKFKKKGGHTTFFIKTNQGAFTWWQPIDIYIIEQFDAIETRPITEKTIFEKIDLTSSFNDPVTKIFQNKYLSPRPTSPTLQLPTQGIGNWAYHSVQVNISDSGLAGISRNAESNKNISRYSFSNTGVPKVQRILFLHLCGIIILIQ